LYIVFVNVYISLTQTTVVICHKLPSIQYSYITNNLTQKCRHLVIAQLINNRKVITQASYNHISTSYSTNGFLNTKVCAKNIK